jgi:hypothetical protein
MPAEIVCTECGEESFLKREPVYEGFRKTGETLSCLSCGHVFAGEEDVPFKERSGPAVFDESDRSSAVDVFDESEKGRTCRHCRHYVVNPFTQWCGQHHREVEATDSCDDFDPPPAPER